MESGSGFGSPMTSCPFLRNVSAATNFDLQGSCDAFTPGDDSCKRSGPIFSDDSSFSLAFKLFHGEGGVVPLARAASPAPSTCASQSASCDAPEVEAAGLINASSAPFASLSVSSFGMGGPFGYHSFQKALELRKQKQQQEEQQRRRREEEQRRQEEKQRQEAESHEAFGEDWLATGKCPIAKSYRAFTQVLPAVAAAFKPRPGVKYECPAAIVALRAALATHPAMKVLRPQALPVRVLAIGSMGLMLNVPLGAWREHLEKFSPQWILVVHASVPFVAMLRKAALMPKYAMAFTIAASIIGQTIGSRMERKRVSSTQTKALPRLQSRRLGKGMKGLDNAIAEAAAAPPPIEAKEFHSDVAACASWVGVAHCADVVPSQTSSREGIVW